MNRACLRLIGLLAVTLSSSLYAQSDLSDRLIAHLPLDGEVVDTVSGVIPTVLQGTSRVEGKIDGAIHFDGKSFVQLPVDLSPEAVPEFTVTMWAKPDRLPEDPELRAAFAANGYLLSDGYHALLMITNQSKEIPNFTATSTGAVVSGTKHAGMRGGWQLLAITRKVEDRTNAEGEVLPHTVLTLYSNGRVSEVARVHRTRAINPYISFGSISKGSSYTYRGAIDDVRIYARAMTPEEIRSSATAPTQTRAVGTRADAPSSGQDTAVDNSEANGDPQPYSPFGSPDIDAPNLIEDLDPKVEFTGDWAIRKIERVDSDDLYPGSKFRVRVHIEKNDPDSRFPSVRLRVGSEPSSQVSSTSRVTVSLQIPTLLTSESLQFNAWLGSPNGGDLDDYHPSNNRMQITVPVKQYSENDEQAAAEPAGDDQDTEPTTPYSYPDVAVHSSTSGSQGQKFWTLYDYPGQDVVTHIDVYEKQTINKPCRISVQGSEDAIGSASGCEISSPAAPYAGVGKNPITALEVCHSTFNKRVKGLRVWRQALKADGSYDGYRPYEANNRETLFERANCSRWRGRVNCDRDAVATGIRTHVSDDNEIIGLQLMCSAVTPN